jgi:AcrR family transcriptional regulator
MTAVRSLNPKEERRLLHQELSRTQLLDAAEEIFGRKGFHETTLKEIADRADFSVGSVYSFFQSKDDLYISVWLRRGEEFLPGLESAIAHATDGIDGIARIVDFEVNFLRARPSFSNLYLRSTGSLVPMSNEVTSEKVFENADRALRIQAEVIAQGQKEGVVRSGDPAALSRLLSAMVQAFQNVDNESADPLQASFSLDEFQLIVSSAFSARS